MLTEEQKRQIQDYMLKPEELEGSENADIRAELDNPEFANRTHATRSTYAGGCRGPLCRKSERDRARQRHEQKQKAKGVKVKPAAPRPERERDYFLRRVIYWHRHMRRNPQSNKFVNMMRLDFDPFYTREADEILRADRVIHHDQTGYRRG